MKDFEKDESNPLVKLTFRVEQNSGGQTGILVNKAVVRETGEVEGTDLVLDGYDREIAFKYTLSWSGSTIGNSTVLTVKDSSGNPVSGMGFQVTAGDQTVALETRYLRVLVTDLFGTYPAGTTFRVWTADASGALSNVAEIPVYESLGSADPEKIVVTTGEDPSTSVGISWETSLDIAESSLIIGKEADLSDGQTMAGEGKTITTSSGGHERLYKAWGVRVSDLEPDTTYYYQVGQEGHMSEIRSFQTAKAAGEDVTIAFYGDIQGAYTSFPNAIEALKAMYPDTDLNLIAGDVSDSGQLYSEWTSHPMKPSEITWEAGSGQLPSETMILILTPQTFTSMFYGPDNGTYSTARNYSFEIGDMVFYNLDTEAVYSYDPDFSGQIANMKKVFGESGKTYKVVLMHRSSYPMNYDEADVRALHTAFDEMGVDLVLSGHDHIYSRTNMEGGEKAAQANGTYYVVGGCSSGSKYYGADANGRTLAGCGL